MRDLPGIQHAVMTLLKDLAHRYDIVRSWEPEDCGGWSRYCWARLESGSARAAAWICSYGSPVRSGSATEAEPDQSAWPRSVRWCCGLDLAPTAAHECGQAADCRIISIQWGRAHRLG